MTDRELLELLVQKISGMEKEIQDIKSSQIRMEEKQDRCEKKLDGVVDQVAGLTEFKEATTERLEKINAKLDQVVKDVEFLKYKEYQNEQDIFHLKKRL